MRAIKPRQKALLVIMISLVILIILRIALFYRNIRMPNIHYKTNVGAVIERKSFQGFRVGILFINSTNSIALGLLDHLKKTKNRSYKFIIFCQDLIMHDKVSQMKNFCPVREYDRKQILKEFHLSQKIDNIIMIYDNNLELADEIPIKPKYFSNILSNFADDTEFLGNKKKVFDICSRLSYEFKKLDDGNYFFTNKLFSSCGCFRVYEEYEHLCELKGDKLRLILVGNWGDVDMQNISKERDKKILVERANGNINKIIDEIGKGSSNLSVNIIVGKRNNNTYILPLTDSADLDKWASYKKTLLAQN